MKFLKNNISNILCLAFALILLFSTDAKAILQQSLMKIGFFQPDLKYNSMINHSKDYLFFEIKDQNGKIVSLNDLKGKVVFLNFWATWCPPCIAEMPSIQILHDKFKSNVEVVILTVEVDGNKEKIQKFMKRKKLHLPVYYPNTSIPSSLFNGNLPTTIILDKKGNIAHTTLGMADYSGQAIVDFLLEVQRMH